MKNEPTQSLEQALDKRSVTERFGFGRPSDDSNKAKLHFSLTLPVISVTERFGFGWSRAVSDFSSCCDSC